MKKILYTIAIICSAGTLLAQNNLGVDQPNPQAKVHVTNTTNQKSLLIEDEANDATPFVIDSVGNVRTGAKLTTDSLMLPTNASNGAVLTSDASGNASWKGKEMAIYYDKKTAGTEGGASTGGLWHTRDLTFTQYESGTSISRSGNVVNLAPGTYYIFASAPAFKTGQHQLVIRDQSNIILINGSSEHNNGTYYVENRSIVDGVITVTVATQIILSHYVSTSISPDGLGIYAGNGVDPVYSMIRIEKIK